MYNLVSIFDIAVVMKIGKKLIKIMRKTLLFVCTEIKNRNSGE